MRRSSNGADWSMDSLTFLERSESGWKGNEMEVIMEKSGSNSWTVLIGI
jgi:hypothetical protein